MKLQALFLQKMKVKKLKRRLLQFLFGTFRLKCLNNLGNEENTKGYLCNITRTLFSGYALPNYPQ